MSWERPTSAPFPAVYRRHVGKKAMSNGKFPKFRIQDAPPEMEEEVVDHMVNIFLRDEPLCAACKFIEDAVSVEEMRLMWQQMYRRRMALVALLEEDDGTTRLAGVNMTGISERKDKDKENKYNGVAMSHVFGTLDHVTKLANLYGRYDVTEYLTAAGLSVSPEFRGQGIGLELLLSRIPLCRATGVKLTGTFFAAANSQELARRAGFEVLAEVDYTEFQVDGKEMFPGITPKSCKYMALKID